MAHVGDDDPFKDPSLNSAATPQPPDDAPDTLVVGRSASLTLGTDCLVVLDEALREAGGAGCCGVSLPGSESEKTAKPDKVVNEPAGSNNTRSIPFYNILWAENSDQGDITIQYAHPISTQVVRPTVINYQLDKQDRKHVDAWVEKLLTRAYGASQRQKRIKVLVNPFGGQGNALKMYHKHIAPVFAAAQCELDVEQTQHKEHGVEIAQNLDIEKYDAVACCSGDGIPHEVWNGFSKRQDAARALAKIAVVQLPCGSGNAMSLNFNGTDSPSLAALAVVKGLRTPQDLISVTQADRRILSFLSQSVGIIAEMDLGTEHLRWMGGARFTWGFLVRCLQKTVYPADIAVKVEYDSKAVIRDLYRDEAAKPPRSHDDRPLPAPDAGLPPLKYGTINDPLPSSWDLVPHDHLGNFYAGKLAYMSADANFFPAALPSDGCIDLVRIRGDLPRLKAMATGLAVANHTFFDLPDVDYQKISAYRIIPKNQKDGYISIDGERIPFEPFQAEIHRGLGTVLSKSGHLYEARGV